ncbi:DoxX family protein [Gracilibacillus alcaliphilus]|uniref:DoxX family protein n=1 Tax=Gracilibacillus alcaliphilus TaxID=1401441 RepID=UPI0030845B76|nr:putative membrane protein YphA (DoxX/SURF4 family) [Gracilibacillus alcaliphilus]
MMNKPEIGTLLLRVFLGVTFFIHGLDKFQGGLATTVSTFESMGIPVFLTYVVAIIELVGGMLLLLGVGIKIVSFLFAAVMIGSIITTKFEAGFLGGFELDLALLVISLFMIISKKHLFSMDDQIVAKLSGFIPLK